MEAFDIIVEQSVSPQNWLTTLTPLLLGTAERQLPE